MEVFVLGSGVGALNLKRSYPGLFIKSEQQSLLVDPGPGSIRQLLKAGFSCNDVDLIVFTHFHPDHCLDFISFLFACKYSLRPRERDLSVVGAPGLEDFYKGAVGIFGKAIIPEAFKLSLKEAGKAVLKFGKTELTTELVAHSDIAIGIRYEDESGKILCYSGDTDYCSGIVELARKADLLILECSFPDEGKVEGHLTPSFAGRIAREADAHKLVLTHFYPVCDGYDILAQCKKEFNGESQMAYDLMKIDV